MILNSSSRTRSAERPGQVRHRGDERGPGARIDGQHEVPGEAQRPQYAQVILREAVGRLAHGAQDRIAQIDQPAVRVAQLLGERVPGEGVNGEVAPAQVLVHRVGEFDHGVPAVGRHVATEGGHLVEHAVARQHADGAVLHADRHGALEDAPHFVRARIGGQVPIGVRQAQQRIAHGTADRPRVVAAIAQLAGDVEDGPGGRRPQGAYPHSTDPPFTFTISPVMWRASAEHRNTIGPATSSALATRPSGIPAAIRLSPSPAYEPAAMSVSTQPGATQFDGDVMGRHLDGESLHQRDDSALGGGVVAVPGLAALAGGG